MNNWKETGSDSDSDFVTGKRLRDAVSCAGGSTTVGNGRCLQGEDGDGDKHKILALSCGSELSSCRQLTVRGGLLIDCS